MKDSNQARHAMDSVMWFNAHNCQQTCIMSFTFVCTIIVFLTAVQKLLVHGNERGRVSFLFVIVGLRGFVICILAQHCILFRRVSVAMHIVLLMPARVMF